MRTTRSRLLNVFDAHRLGLRLARRSLSLGGGLLFAILRSKIYPSFDINHQLISEFINLSFGIFRYLPFFENGRSLPLGGELLLEILWSKIYPSFDINDDRPCLFPNLPTYVRSFEKRSQWYYFVSNSRDITSFVIRQNTNRASRYSALDVIKIFRARMKSYRSTWFVILVARYRVTIAKLHSLSDPLPSARTFLSAIYHRESCRVGFLRLWSNR